MGAIMLLLVTTLFKALNLSYLFISIYNIIQDQPCQRHLLTLNLLETNHYQIVD